MQRWIAGLILCVTVAAADHFKGHTAADNNSTQTPGLKVEMTPEERAACMEKFEKRKKHKSENGGKDQPVSW